MGHRARTHECRPGGHLKWALGPRWGQVSPLGTRVPVAVGRMRGPGAQKAFTLVVRGPSGSPCEDRSGVERDQNAKP